MEKLFGVYGASGFGREVMPVARASCIERQYKFVFIDDSCDADYINGYPVVSFESFIASDQKEKLVSIAIADSHIRQKLYEKCVKAGLRLANVKASNVVVLDECEIAEGAIISPFVTVTSNVEIGKCFHANIYSYIAHDCRIGDFVTFAPGVKCNGNVVVSNHAYIGTGAILKQGKAGTPLIIGEGAVVGMGAVVTKNVLPGAVVVGNPAKALIK